MNHFSDCKDVNEIKKKFRQLAKEHHPDHGGNPAIMREVLEQYHAALKDQDRTVYQGTDDRPHTYYYNAEQEEQIAAKLSEVLALEMEDVEIWIAGLYVWIRGNTRPHKDALGKKGAGFYWNRKRSAWAWKPAGVKASRYNRNAQSLDDILDIYNGKQAKKGPGRSDSQRPNRPTTHPAALT